MESELIAHLRRTLPAHPLLRLGPGDDAAVLRLVDSVDCVVTVDMLMDGVDFLVDQVEPWRIGRKSLAVNLSDLAAMASRPIAAVVALALPRRGGLELAKRFYEGLIPLAEQFQTAIAGGDTNSWDGPLVVSITVMGSVGSRGVWRRAGAKPGDVIVATGQFGGSILGRHLDFTPRVNEALALAERYDVHAAIDVSDGLSLDLSRIAEESGCGAVLKLDAVPISDDARRLSQLDGRSPLEHALSDGEDFELLLAVPPNEAQRMMAERPINVPLSVIGQFIAEPGLWSLGASGERNPLPARGYQHEMD